MSLKQKDVGQEVERNRPEGPAGQKYNTAHNGERKANVGAKFSDYDRDTAHKDTVNNAGRSNRPMPGLTLAEKYRILHVL